MRLGSPIHQLHPIAPNLPNIDNLPQLFPAIRHLKLGSNIFTSKLLTSLSQAPDLCCIHLDVDAPLFPAQLCDLIAGLHRSPTLVTVEINICYDDHEMVRPQGATRVPQWDTGMKRAQAKFLLKMAAFGGVQIMGSALCAMKICEGVGGNGHVCARAPSWIGGGGLGS